MKFYGSIFAHFYMIIFILRIFDLHLYAKFTCSVWGTEVLQNTKFNILIHCMLLIRLSSVVSNTHSVLCWALDCHGRFLFCSSNHQKYTDREWAISVFLFYLTFKENTLCSHHWVGQMLVTSYFAHNTTLFYKINRLKCTYYSYIGVKDRQN